ncbi:hypothetical protein Xvie_03566 [Xenorhabdus vietnamensis]|uniref:Uncharacterized protein n=1 Tax=Xenorhabdus vietnamensis TaxID=351656 RepID=A0A1Y2SAS3_9GAMM|nr:hypothetical protein [Xenorhabdus vietnamensis]OTA14629.1 hypothetical protein Xvie_03566 [Xenorhabdus vietnamensis]
MSDSAWKLNIPVIISIVSVVVSGMAWWQVKEQTRMQELNYEKSTEPHITVVPTVDPENGYKGFYLFNGGLGTGYIESVKIKINNEIISDNSSGHGVFHTLAKRLRVLNTNSCFKYGMPRKGDPVILNYMSPLWAASGDKFDCAVEHFQLHNVLLDKNLDVDIMLIYKSIYGVTYQYSSKSNLKTRL